VGAVQDIEPLWVVEPATPYMWLMLVAMIWYRQPVLRSKSVSFFRCRREGLLLRTSRRCRFGQPSL
jgi:hypothetical protein